MTRIIAGRQPVIEALRAGTPIDQIVLLTGIHGKIIHDITALAEQKNVRIKEIGRQEFRELASDATTQGVVAMIPAKHQFVSLDQITEIGRERNEAGFLLILDEIEDPHNLGALIRTAECAGAHGVVIPKHRSATVTSTVVKTSAGAAEYMAICEATNIVALIEELKQRDYWIVGLDPRGDKAYSAIDYRTPTAIVVGSEGKGIRRLVREHCDFLVHIPLFGKIESLNASVAGAIVMYEVAEQRH
jgi:23S rRNA (guanosine2251-2'-O)-methyltransferase